MKQGGNQGLNIISRIAIAHTDCGLYICSFPECFIFYRLESKHPIHETPLNFQGRMSKKHKIRKKITVPEKSSETGPVSVPASPKSPGSSNNRLIVFDRKTYIFIGVIFLAYIITSSLKIHTSNIANWDIFFGLEKSESVIAGKPRFIRMDEWMISSPGAIGQYNAGMPLKNESVGDLNAPVVWGLPVKDISTLLRPHIWSYFVFDVERAFAFSWNFNIFFFLISTFLLLMLLTRNNFLLSITGTFFIFLSGGVQWWSYFISNYMLYLNGMFLSVIYILYSKKISTLVIAAVVFIFSAYGFIFNLYPPFQVPLVYLYLFLFTGFILQRKNYDLIKNNWRIKALVFSSALVILAIFTYHYYSIVKDTYAMMLNTVYPGRRFSTGGDLKNGKVFAEFFAWYMTDTNTPQYWMNICEASGFIMFFPIAFYGIGYYYYKTKKTDPILITLSVFVIVGLIYVLLGFPAFLSRITLFSMSPAFRVLPIVGVGNCFLLICFLASNKTILKNEKFSWIEFGAIALVTFVFMRIIGSQVNKATENFFTATQVTIVTMTIVAAYLLTRYKNFKFVSLVLYALLLAMVIPNLNVNPVTKGLAPILENPLVVDSKELYQKDPKGRWAVFGNTRLSHLLKTNGFNLFNSVKLVPPMKDMKVLDPAGKFDSTYNRYAWMTMDSKQIAQYLNANWKDTVFFRQTFQDGYTIFVDPCSPKLKQLGVRYYVFDYAPSSQEVRCLTKLKENAGLFYYKRNDE